MQNSTWTKKDRDAYLEEFRAILINYLPNEKITNEN